MTAALLIGCAAVGGCGKKGPPLAPIVRVPGAVSEIAARRLGNDVYVTVTIPDRNIDDSTPADVRRVEVYGYTGLTTPGARFLEGGALVATIPVAPPALRTGAGSEARPAGGSGDLNDAVAQQGMAITIRDRLEGEELEARTLPPAPQRGRRSAAVDMPAPSPPSGPLRRFYMAIGFSDRERSGPAGEVASLPLGMLPDPPAGPMAEYTPEMLSLRWEPSGGFIGFLVDRMLPQEPSPVEELSAGSDGPAQAELPPGPTRYNVYREIAPDPLAFPDGPPPAPWQAELPRPLNPTPTAALSFVDPIVFDERQRCYLVRAVRGAGPTMVESEPSPRICFTPIDTVPPEVPADLNTQAVDGAITLLWEPNIEEDLAGYLVLRGAPGDATLTALTETPVAVARYVDRTVVPGTRYVYAVVAVDSRVPLGNRSAESERVEETAR